MSLAEPQAARVAVREFVDLLEQHRAAWKASRAPSGKTSFRPFSQDQIRELELSILQRHAQVASIAQRVSPGLDDLVGLRLHTNPRQWKFEALAQSAHILLGALESLDATSAMLGSTMSSEPSLSTPQQRSQYGLALLKAGAG